MLFKPFLFLLIFFYDVVYHGVQLNSVHLGKAQQAVLCLVFRQVADEVGEHHREVEEAVVMRIGAVHGHDGGVVVCLAEDIVAVAEKYVGGFE